MNSEDSFKELEKLEDLVAFLFLVEFFLSSSLHLLLLLLARIGLLHRDAKTGEFAVPIAFADAEIEPSAG